MANLPGNDVGNVGNASVGVLPDADRKIWKASLAEQLAGLSFDVPVGLKLKRGAVTDVANQAKAQTKALKNKPSIAVDLKVARGAAAKAIREANTEFKKLKRPPRLNVELGVTVPAVKRAVKEANAKLKVAKAAPPKLDVQLNLTTDELEAIKEVRVLSKEVEAAIKADPIELTVDLDKEAQAALLAKVRLLKAKADAAGIASFQRTQGRIRALEEAGLDQRSLINQRFENQRALIAERANARIQRSSGLSLRILRNDLSQFDASTTRVLRRLGLVFAGFTAAVTASFAAIGVAALRSFAETETQIRRTAAVLGTDAFSETIAATNDQTKAFAAFRREVERTDEALRGTVELTALKTVFNPTEIAAGTRALAQAGLKTEEIKASLLGVAQFAQNEELLPEEAVANLVQGATAAGQSLKELTLLSDQFTFVANDTTASAKEVAEAFANRAAPAFRAYGESVSSTLTVLDLFARAGIRGKTAGEQTGILIREVNKASTKTKDTAAAWEKYGIAIGKVNGKQVPFLETLAELGTLLENVRRNQGSQGLAKIRKELGLTEKSGAGLLQILPQITKDTAGSAAAAVKNLQNVQTQIDRAAGATSRQADIITNTLGFQFEQFTNQIGTLFRIAAGPTGKALTDTFRRFNDQLEDGGKNGKELRDRFLEIGDAISKRVVPSLERFFFGGEGGDFLSGTVEMYRGFLTGLQDAFSEFRDAAFGEGSNKGFFTVLGDSFAAIGRFAESTLPRIGRAFGVVTKFLRENEILVRSFFKAWLTAFVASKALRLFIIPVLALSESVKKLGVAMSAITGLGFTNAIVAQTAAMAGLGAASTATAGAVNAVALAEARLIAASAARGLKSFRLKRGKKGIDGTDILANAAEAEAAYARRAALSAALAKAFERLSRTTTVLGSALRALGVLFIPVTIAFGIFKGVVDQLNFALGGDGNVTIQDFKSSIKGIAQAVDAVIGPLLKAIELFAKFLFYGGKILGILTTLGLTAAVRALGDALGWVVEKGGGAKNVLAGIASSIPVIGPAAASAVPAVGQLAGSFSDIKKSIDDTFGPTSETRLMLGSFLQDTAEYWRPYSASLASIFDDAAGAANSAVDEIDAKYERSIAKFRFRAMERKRIAHEAAQAELRATGILGVTSDSLLPKYIKLTAAQKALGLSTEQAAEKASVFQKRQASLAYASDLLAGKVTNQTQLNRLLDASNLTASANMVKLYGSEQKVAEALDLVASGNERAGRAAIANAKIAAEAAKQKAQAVIDGARDEIEAIGASAQANMRASMVVGVLQNRIRGAMRRQREAAGYVEEITSLVNDLGNAATGGADLVTAASDAAADSAAEVKTAAQQATDAVNKLTQAQLNRQAAVLVGKVTKAAAGGYKATAREAEILRRVLPGVEAQLQSQTDAVAKLDEALQGLQGTQLKGTKAFNDQAFEFEQQIKKLQLQRADLVIAGTVEEDPVIASIDAQIKAIQQQADRAQLAFDIDTAPLKKKLEETFTPIKELSGDEILKQFKKLSDQKAPLVEAIAGGEQLKATLDATIKDADARFGDAGKQVTLGFVGGIKGQLPQVQQAGQLTGDAALKGVNSVMQFGSPSRTMIQRGQWVNDGFVQGVNSSIPQVQRAGVDSMWGFLEGMRNVYQNRVQPFVLQIAEWIRANKGPISYDRTLLRPAGQAMMEGFAGGLRDGFGEIQSWVRQVGPSLANDTFPKDIFIKRSAHFLLNNARMDAQFDPQDAFGDLLFDAGLLGGGMAPAGLSFLHKTLSSADTLDMAKKLANMFGTPISSFIRPGATVFGTGRPSDHREGTAVDFSNGQNPTPQMDALYAAIDPLIGKIFKQVLYRTNVGGNHFNHVHAAWLKGEGFSMNSGKKGGINFPGASELVNMALAEAAQKTGVNPLLLGAVAKAESGFNPRAGSPAGAQGLMQLMPATARGFGVTDIFDPVQNALGGAKFLRNLLAQYGSIKLALAGYNAGPGNVAKYGGVPPFAETIAYIERVMRYFMQFSSGNFRAQGGKVNAMTPYTVGERGQELFIPSQNGSVVSNKDLRDLIAAMREQGGGRQQLGTTINDNRTIEVRSNSNDAAVVRALFDSRMRSQIVGVRR